MNRSRLWWMCALSGWLALASAQAAEPDRQQIVAARQAIQRDFAAQELACQQRFAVTDCVEDVRLRRRQALAPWREKELALDAADRQRRASERQAAIKAKMQAAAAEPASAPPVLPRERKAMAEPSATRPVAPPAADPAHAAAAAARVQEANQRKAEAKAAQERVARRQAERADKAKAGKAVMPLPVPARSAASGAASGAASSPR